MHFHVELIEAMHAIEIASN